ncbi:ATP synthase F0 subunit B [bacterium]|nr:ATP synthase F0 subunit B [bacterium]
MEITWQQVLVEASGFLLVWWAFAKFLVGPITKVLDDRAVRVRSDLEGAEAQRLEMEKLRADYEHRLTSVEEEIRSRLSDAVARGEALIAEREKEAGARADKIRAKVETEIKEMRNQLRRELRADAARMVMEVSRRFLSTKMENEDETLIARLMEEVSPSVET